ncbi:unnamed protein product [Chironomus riparius]|uniref:Homeobox domain-containing protein n=1 Tax=Chironomus riparius TaxID=315576 RepID=A0A9N9RVN3_9DIPT|nr:unnamed protein product [Chironomus riparius]
MEKISLQNITMDINLPRDYSLSSSDIRLKSDMNEANNNNSNNNNNHTLSKSMKLNFGVERLLSKNYDKLNKHIDESKDKGMLLNLVSNNIETDTGNNYQGLNLLHQQLINTNINGLPNQNCILKPFPLRFGKNHNGYMHQPPSYFQSSLRKVSMTDLSNSSSNYSAINVYQNILRLPSIAQLSPNTSAAQYLNQKMVKTASDAEKVIGMIPSNGNVKRKRSWSRAVFSNLQRKGLERQFEFQKYITKPDRKKLAARLGLKDSQVKVWFQNRRMKWRHSTRGTTISGKIVNSHENSDVNDDDEQFTSSDEEDTEIDVVTDH